MIKFPLARTSGGITAQTEDLAEYYQQRLTISIGNELGTSSFARRRLGSRINQVRGKADIADVNLVINSEVNNAIDDIGNISLNNNQFGDNLGISITQNNNEELIVDIRGVVVLDFSEFNTTVNF